MKPGAHLSSLVGSLSETTGVPREHVQKVLDSLGLDALEKELASSVSPDRLKQIRAGDLKLGVRLGRSSVAV